MLDNPTESYVDKVLRSGADNRAVQLREFGKATAVWLNALTSFGFGYFFVRPIPTDATLFGASIAGIIGGAACAALTDGMARIWNTTRLRASESEQQHDIASTAYWLSVAVSVTMTLIYSIVVIFQWTDGTGTQATLIGRIVITAVSVAQLLMWILFENASPEYRRSLVRTVTRVRFNDAVLDAEAEAIDKARDEARQLLAPYVPRLASQIARSGASQALRTLSYDDARSEQLPPLSADSANQPTPQQPAGGAVNFTPATIQHSANGSHT